MGLRGWEKRNATGSEALVINHIIGFNFFFWFETCNLLLQLTRGRHQPWLLSTVRLIGWILQWFAGELGLWARRTLFISSIWIWHSVCWMVWRRLNACLKSLETHTAIFWILRDFCQFRFHASRRPSIYTRRTIIEGKESGWLTQVTSPRHMQCSVG